MFATLHTRLNQLALSSSLTRAITYALASTLAYALVAFGVLSLYIGVPKTEFITSVFAAFAAATLSRILVEAIYYVYKRPRPSKSDNIEPLFVSANPSFPSGHAAFFSAIATALILLDTPFALSIFVATAVLCIARVLAGIHFLSDILAGYALGVGTTLILLSLLGYT